MSEEITSESPVPLPRTKLPVPRPRTKVVTNDEHNVQFSEEVSSSSESLETPRSVSSSDRGMSQEPRSRSLNRSSLRESLRAVTSNVQERSSAVLENTKLVGAKIGKSVHSILKRNSGGASVCGSDVTNPSDTDFTSDNIFNDIKFGSPIINEEKSLPPPYPPPPLPDAFYDDLSSIRSSPPESHYSYPSSPMKADSFYEEIPFLKKVSVGVEGSESDSSSSQASTSNSHAMKSDSWNFFAVSDKCKEADLKLSFPLSTEASSSPSTSDSGRPCTEQSEMVHSYENFMPSRVPPSKFPQNVYSEMPPKSDKSGSKSVSSVPESVGSKSNSIYENWGPIVCEDLSSLETKNVKPLLLHSDTLISEFDPLLKDNPLLQKVYESRIKSKIHPFDACDEDSDDSGKKTNTTLPESENFYEMASNCSEGESVADSSVMSPPAGGELHPGDSSTLESNKKRIARWSSMKEAVRKIYDRTNRRMSEGWELPPKPPACLHTSLHTGYLYKLSSMTDNPKNLVNKWCTLGEGKLSFCTEKSSAPKDILLLDNIIAIQLLLDPKSSEAGEVIHCWELIHSSKGKPCIVGCTAPTERRIWMQKILEALTQVFPTSLASSYTRVGWAYLRESSIGAWNIVWILLQKRTLHVSYSKGKNFEIDLRKVINLELMTKGENEEIVVDTQEVSFRFRTTKDLKAWSKVLKAAAVDNGTSLSEQQLTKDNVPTIVDKCVSFVYAHGCMSEGIYRRSGSSANIQRLLTDLRKDAWSVRISQHEYSEHDVSTALKRFFRDLPDPLLTKEHHDYLCNASNIKCNKSDKILMYRNCLEKLPLVNYVTARKLLSHLHYISLQADKNLMTCENLAAIWAPTLMQVQDGDGTSKWSKQEFQVVFDLIMLFKPVFLVGESEVAIEKRIQEVLEKVHRRGGPNHHEPSGNLKIWVYINSKESGDCINVSVDPERQAGDVVNELCSKRDMESHECCLQEVCLSDALVRPLHHTEKVFNTVIRWAYWHHAHRKDNYLVLTHNHIFKQIAAAIVTPQLTKCGEIKFAGPKMKSFKSYMFEFSQAKLSYFKDSKFHTKLGEWPVEDVVFYMGQDPRRTSNAKWSLTLVPKSYQSEAAPKEWFGYTLAGTHDDLLEWLSAFHLAQYGASEVLPRPTISRLVT